MPHPSKLLHLPTQCRYVHTVCFRNEHLTGATVLVEPVGTRQLPAMQETDLRVEKTFHVRAGSVVGLYADIFNVTNRVVAARVNQSSGSSFERVQNWTQPRRFRAGVRVTF